MADKQLVNLIKKGVGAWNKWVHSEYEKRRETLKIDLRGADFSGMDLDGIYLSFADLIDTTFARANLCDSHFVGAELDNTKFIEANLTGSFFDNTDLHGTNFYRANLTDADFSDAKLTDVIFTEANLTEADISRATFVRGDFFEALFNNAVLCDADLSRTDLSRVSFKKADLSGANFEGAYIYNTNLSGAKFDRTNLTRARLIESNIENAIFSDCYIYGISAWDLKTNKKTTYANLIITKKGESVISVDNIEIAQFIHLLLRNEKIRHIIDTITSKVVLVLGRFTPTRKIILETIRGKLRECGYIPVLFDFEKPSKRDTQETISTLALLSRFIIVDITEPRSVPQELVSIVQSFPSLPVQPLLKQGSKAWGMYDHIERYSSVLKIIKYDNQKDLLALFKERIIRPIEKEIGNRVYLPKEFSMGRNTPNRNKVKSIV